MKVAVVGEAMLDLTAYHAALAPNPESATVLTVKAGPVAVDLGGAGNVAAFLAARGHEVSLFTPAGGWAASLVADCCRLHGIQYHWLHNMPAHWHTPVKFRFFVDGTYASRHDLEQCPPAHDQRPLLEAAGLLPKHLDAVIFSDYAKGLYADEDADYGLEAIRAVAPVTVADFKPQHRHLFRSVDAVAPNQREADACGWPTAEAVQSALGCAYAFVTLGTNGCAWSDGEKSGVSPLAQNSGEWYIGAGDAFTAAVTEAIVSKIGDVQAVADYANTVACTYTQNKRNPILRL